MGAATPTTTVQQLSALLEAQAQERRLHGYLTPTLLRFLAAAQTHSSGSTTLESIFLVNEANPSDATHEQAFQRFYLACRGMFADAAAVRSHEAQTRQSHDVGAGHLLFVPCSILATEHVTLDCLSTVVYWYFRGMYIHVCAVLLAQRERQADVDAITIRQAYDAFRNGGAGRRARTRAARSRPGVTGA